MKQGTERISQLIDQLKVNDKIDPNEVDDDPPEPKEAMEELAKIGQPTVAPLIKVLKNPSNYSCVYAITILGRIAAPEAAKPIVEAFTSENYINSRVTYALKDYYSEAYEALRKIGLPALEPTLAHLKKKREQKDHIGILEAMDILVNIQDERSFAALVDLLNDDAVQKEDIINDLVKYGDNRAVKYLRELIKPEQDEDERRGIFEAIRDLEPADTQAYRDMIAPYAIKDISKLSEPIHRALYDLKQTHESIGEFEGDNASEFNSIVYSYRAQEAIDSLLHAVFELGSYEGILPNQIIHEDSKLSKLRVNWCNFKDENDEVIKIISNRFPEECQSQVTKSYKGLAVSRYESGPKIANLKDKIQQWLKEQGFSITTRRGEVWGFKGKKGQRQGCIVTSGSDYDRSRSWGNLYLGVWGNGWTENQANSFSTAFWEFSEKTIAELLCTKKLQSITINHEN
jgi:HEAT repeat protein